MRVCVDMLLLCVGISKRPGPGAEFIDQGSAWWSVVGAPGVAYLGATPSDQFNQHNQCCQSSSGNNNFSYSGWL